MSCGRSPHTGGFSQAASEHLMRTLQAGIHLTVLRFSGFIEAI